jgi:hypothetical protein
MVEGSLHGKIGYDASISEGITYDQMLELADRATERAFPSRPRPASSASRSWHLPYEIEVEVVQSHPDWLKVTRRPRPHRGHERRAPSSTRYGVGIHRRAFLSALVELAPDHARWYPFYAKCVELDVPVQPRSDSRSCTTRPTARSVGRPITLDAVACDFPELKLVGIHVGIPWSDEMIAMAWKHPNVYIGCDAHSPRYWPASFVRMSTVSARTRLCSAPTIRCWISAHAPEIEALGLRRDKRKLCGTTRRIYRLA